MTGGAVSPSPTPQPIPAEGYIQIFANPECTQYADGTQSTVYARINRAWIYNDGWRIDEGPDGGRIDCYGPNEEEPEVQYGMTVWVDWVVETERDEPYNDGEVIELSTAPGTTMVNPTVIFSRPE